MLKYLKLAKLLRLGRIVKYLRKYAKYYGMFLLSFAYLFMVHFTACMYVATVDPCQYTEPAGVCSQENIARIYAASLYDMLTSMIGISTVADHCLPAELNLGPLAFAEPGVRMFNFFVVIVGFIFVCLFFGNTAVVLSHFSSTSWAFRMKIEGIKSEMSYYNLPTELRDKINAYYEYMWINQKHFGDSGLLRDQDMSVPLRQEIVLYLYKDLIRNVPFFANYDDTFLCHVCLLLRPRIYLPDDCLIINGETAEEMFILCKGKVSIQNQMGVEITQLRPGQFFGEFALIYEARRSATVKSVGVTEVSVLNHVVGYGVGR